MANHDQLLAESLGQPSAQVNISAVAHTRVGQRREKVTAPGYGKPTLYVPKLTTYPQWFIAGGPPSTRRTAGSGPRPR